MDEVGRHILKLLDGGAREQKAAAEKLCKMNDVVIKTLIGALGYDDGDNAKITSVLVKIGEPAIDPLIDALKGDKSYLVRRGAAIVLGTVGSAKAVEPLIGALKDENEFVRIVAENALGKIGKPSIIPMLNALDDDNWRVRKAAPQVLASIGATAVKTLVEESKKPERKHVRRTIGEIVKQIEDAIKYIDKRDGMVRDFGIREQKKLAPPKIPGEFERAMLDRTPVGRPVKVPG